MTNMIKKSTGNEYVDSLIEMTEKGYIFPIWHYDPDNDIFASVSHLYSDVATHEMVALFDVEYGFHCGDAVATGATMAELHKNFLSGVDAMIEKMQVHDVK